MELLRKRRAEKGTEEALKELRKAILNDHFRTHLQFAAWDAEVSFP